MYQGPARCRRADPHSPYTTPYWSTALGGGANVDGTTGAVTGPSYVINGNTYTDVGAALSAAAAGSGGGNLLVDASNNTWSSNATAPVAGIKNRSEEPTSELQPLMHPSYDVLCLTKTKIT